MLKIVTIIGARPQIIKSAALNRAIHKYFSNEIEEIIIHTGQHYDYNMSEIFVNDFNISKPAYNLNIGSETHGRQTSLMIQGIEEILLKERPTWCVLFGDTNSTLAGAVASAKINIPIVHIEAGLRSYDKTMPEEINRIVCDHLSTLLFVPTETAMNNLQREGFNVNAKPPYNINNPAVLNCGDIMFDNTVLFKDFALKNTDIIDKLHLRNKNFALCTIHRQNNTDNISRLQNIFSTLIELSEELSMQFIIPLHPRTVKMLNTLPDKNFAQRINNAENLKIIPPVSFFEITALETNSKIILTDSGGVQKEAYFLKKPCVILRNETEWVEIVQRKTAILADDNPTNIKEAVKYFIENPPTDFPDLFGDGQTGRKICEYLLNPNKTRG